MFLPIVLSLVASSFALPALELNSPPEALVNANEHAEILDYQPSSNERQLEEKRILEEEQRAIEEEKRITEEEKQIEEANKMIEQQNKIMEEEEKKGHEEAEKRLIDEEKVMEEKQAFKIILSAVPSAPELLPLDTSVFSTILRAEKLEDSEDASKDVKPFNFMWKIPRIIFPGRFLVDNVYVTRTNLEI